MELIQNADIRGKRVFLRVDLNVPMVGEKITDSNRIRTILPTVKLIALSQAKVIIGAHLGRPEGKRSEETSLASVAKELQRMINLKVELASDVVGQPVVDQIENMPYGGILMLENLRWDKREEANDSKFAEELASLADIYVNDAFAVSHRSNASVDAITKYLPSYAGLLLQSEISNLSALMDNPKHPFILVIGGVKVKDKAGVLEKLAPASDKILVGGGVANTFLKAKGSNISKSVYDEEMITGCKKLLKKYDKKIYLPVDFEREDLENGEFKNFDIGPETRKIFMSEIRKGKTVFWNGSLGYSEDPKYAEGMRVVARTIADIKQTTVIAGGDTAGFVIENGFSNGITFISTGGGAALEFLAGTKLPGIEALKRKVHD